MTLEHSEKQITHVLTAKPTLEGAGVRLHRGFANAEVPRFDPFLLFDDFSAVNPADYLSGFPWHPHRGIETVTYILDGNVRHKDSIGNSGVIGAGDLQWMSAGSGIIHEEMPEGISGIQGFQLWVNIPQKYKMSPPRYQEIDKSLIPEISLGESANARVIAGSLPEAQGPVEDIMADPLYVDISLKREQPFSFSVTPAYTTFIYIIDGHLAAGLTGTVSYPKGTILLFEREGDTVVVRAGSTDARFLLVSGKPLDETVAWHGPIVMNTKEELVLAYEELNRGEFIK